MISDAHVHLDERLKNLLIKHHSPAIISCATPRECEEAIALCERYPFLSYSCGVHPWYVDKINIDTMMPYLKKASIIGEIGMDCVWCKQDRGVQLQIFEEQLAYACNQKKPVILHTKGEEACIAHIIQQYQNTYLVHWYSCMDYLAMYKNLDCYFSIGPDVPSNECVQQVVKEIELDRLVIESDGISAIEWVLGPILDADYQSTLYQILAYIAKVKHKNIEEVKIQVDKNYQAFIQAGRT